MKREQMEQFKMDVKSSPRVCIFASCVGFSHSRGVAVYRRIEGWTLEFNVRANHVHAQNSSKKGVDHKIPFGKIRQTAMIQARVGKTAQEISWIRRSRRRFDRAVSDHLFYLRS
jgi:hypothetical protein